MQIIQEEITLISKNHPLVTRNQNISNEHYILCFFHAIKTTNEEIKWK